MPPHEETNTRQYVSLYVNILVNDESSYNKISDDQNSPLHHLIPSFSFFVSRWNTAPLEILLYARIISNFKVQCMVLTIHILLHFILFIYLFSLCSLLAYLLGH